MQEQLKSAFRNFCNLSHKQAQVEFSVWSTALSLIVVGSLDVSLSCIIIVIFWSSCSQLTVSKTIKFAVKIKNSVKKTAPILKYQNLLFFISVLSLVTCMWAIKSNSSNRPTIRQYIHPLVCWLATLSNHKCVISVIAKSIKRGQINIGICVTIH